MNSRNQNNKDTVHQDIKAKQKRYDALVREMHSDVYRYAYWLVKDQAIAEDIVQETFLRAWKSLDSLKDQKAAKAWLITILRRENARRFERKQFDLVDMDDFSLADDGLGEETKAEHIELHRLMGNLSDEYRDPLILQVIYGYNGEEIAKELNLNKNTVMTRLFRARNQLREALERDN